MNQSLEQAKMLIEEKMALGAPVIVALEGGAATGKSTLAAQLSRHFSAPVISMDEFFLPPALRTAERLQEAGGNIHYERFEMEVAQPIRQQQSFSYRIFDCSQMDFNGEKQISFPRQTPMTMAFFPNARLLGESLQITPLFYGSLGLEYLTGKELGADDIDILIPGEFLQEQWPDFCNLLAQNGYTLTDEHEHAFEKDGLHFAYASIEELESFAGISPADIPVHHAHGCSFRLLTLSQYLSVYRSSIRDGYRIQIRQKKDQEKITLIEHHLEKGIVPTSQLILVEGVYSLHPRYRDIFNLRLFLETSKETQDQRLRNRGEWLYERFQKDWLPMEKRYFDTFRPEQYCDAILRT